MLGAFDLFTTMLNGFSSSFSHTETSVQIQQVWSVVGELRWVKELEHVSRELSDF